MLKNIVFISVLSSSYNYSVNIMHCNILIYPISVYSVTSYFLFLIQILIHFNL